MPVLFKLTEGTNKKSIDKVLGTLAECGFEASRLFPTHSIPSLARTFVIRTPKSNVKRIQRVLERFGSVIEYIETSPNRRTL